MEKLLTGADILLQGAFLGKSRALSSALASDVIFGGTTMRETGNRLNLRYTAQFSRGNIEAQCRVTWTLAPKEESTTNSGGLQGP